MKRSSEERRDKLDIFVKSKATDSQVLDVGQRVAEVCDESVGRAFARWKERLGILRCHERELAIYAQHDDRFRRHAPIVYGESIDRQQQQWLLVLENLTNMELMDSVANIECWTAVHIQRALTDIAEVHAIWYGRESELRAQPWLGPVLSAADIAEMSNLWTALANHSAQFFDDWLAPAVRRQRDQWITTIGDWWSDLERLPRTLIHNDFNPRNIAFRQEADSIRLCAYDWELACLGPAQHDVAELLCFVLSPAVMAGEVRQYLHVHRTALERATGEKIDAELWDLGFQLSLRDLMINRLPFYSLIHTFRSQPFLERVIRTWQRLSQIMEG